MEPRRTPVSSSAIASVGYDPAARTLDVEFRTHAIYRYANVEPEVFAELVRGGDEGSVGRHFAHHVRDRYRFVQLRAPDT